MILIFDLDDTLYEELTYVKSGFRAVSFFLNQYLGIPHKDSFEAMLKVLASDGRGNVFNKILEHYAVNSKHNVKKCIAIYRSHKPVIALTDSARKCLERFSDVPNYIITDGNKIVQKNKIKALNLNKWIKRVFCTHQYGLRNSKPSPYCFKKIANIEKISPKNIVCIGDNPHKDFMDIKVLGFKTIRVLTGNYRFVKLDTEHEAHLSVNSLDEINIKNLCKLGVI